MLFATALTRDRGLDNGYNSLLLDLLLDLLLGFFDRRLRRQLLLHLLGHPYTLTWTSLQQRNSVLTATNFRSSPRTRFRQNLRSAHLY